MTTGEINFICNRKLNIKNSIKFYIYIWSLLIGLVFPWFNSTLWEKIVLGVLLWIDLCVVLLYATRERISNQQKLNGFYGWQMYFLSWLHLYCGYRVVFEQFHWVLLVFIGYGIIQTGLWGSGVIYNIRKDIYVEGSTGLSFFNVFTFMTILLGLVILSLSCSIVYLGYGGTASIIVGGFVFLHYFFLLGITFLIQWCLMVKNKIYNSEQLFDDRKVSIKKL